MADVPTPSGTSTLTWRGVGTWSQVLAMRPGTRTARRSGSSVVESSRLSHRSSCPGTHLDTSPTQEHRHPGHPPPSTSVVARTIRGLRRPRSAVRGDSRPSWPCELGCARDGPDRGPLRGFRWAAYSCYWRRSRRASSSCSPGSRGLCTSTPYSTRGSGRCSG